MKIARIYTGADGESHFEDMEIPMKFHRSDEVRMDPIVPTSMIIREQSGDFGIDFHPAPRRQYIITLSGKVEITIGDGTKRIFGPGEIMLADDTTGRGHISRIVGNEPRVSVCITLD